MPQVLLTADKTLMSSYHDNEFIGFGTCAPHNIIPDAIFSYLFFPPLKTNKGYPYTAPYGLRKIEAQLKKENFDVNTIDPRYLQKYIDDVKVIGIYVMDPFGLGPASSTLGSIFKKTPFLAVHFENLLSDPILQKAKRNGAKIIVGGPGTWQFHHRENFVKKYKIDCILEGEAEKVIGKICRASIERQALPQYYSAGVDETPKIDEIPDITQPSINGLIEIGRGCCRGCQFCNVTLRPLRWYPIEKVAREINVNINSGKVKSACLHAEDVMLYGSKNYVPNEEQIVKLHKMVRKSVDNISWSHCSLAAVASSPKAFKEISEIILTKQTWWGAEIGIETGSSRIAQKIMPAKTLPFKPIEWPQVVQTGLGLMHDNKLVPAGTLIVGMPEETEEDVIKTIDMVDDVKDYRSLIVPLYFVPLGRLKNEDWFNDTHLSKRHRELLFKCAEHDFRWVDNLIDMSFNGLWYSPMLRFVYKAFSGVAKRGVRKIKIKSSF